MGGTSEGDALGSQSVDVGRVDVADRVGEDCRLGGGQCEGSGQETRHLGAGDRLVGAVQGRVEATPPRYLQFRHFLHIGSPPRSGFHIRKPGGVNDGRTKAEHQPPQPHRHYPPRNGIVGTEPVHRALGADEGPHLFQGLDRLGVFPRFGDVVVI